MMARGRLFAGRKHCRCYEVAEKLPDRFPPLELTRFHIENGIFGENFRYFIGPAAISRHSIGGAKIRDGLPGLNFMMLHISTPVTMGAFNGGTQAST